MGVITATFGGIVRDLLGGESPVILSREIYASAALAGAVAFVVLMAAGAPRELAVAAGFAIGLLVRAAALRYGWSLHDIGSVLVIYAIRYCERRSRLRPNHQGHMSPRTRHRSREALPRPVVREFRPSLQRGVGASFQVITRQRRRHRPVREFDVFAAGASMGRRGLARRQSSRDSMSRV
jgi:hypothetical protein